VGIRASKSIANKNGYTPTKIGYASTNLTLHHPYIRLLKWYAQGSKTVERMSNYIQQIFILHRLTFLFILHSSCTLFECTFFHLGLVHLELILDVFTFLFILHSSCTVLSYIFFHLGLVHLKFILQSHFFVHLTLFLSCTFFHLHLRQTFNCFITP